MQVSARKKNAYGAKKKENQWGTKNYTVWKRDLENRNTD